MHRFVPAAAVSGVFTLLIFVSFWDPARYRLPGDPRGYEPVQPIAYSHEVHAGDHGIDCRFCHYAAESSRTAGVPDAATCMKCHTQIKKDSPEVAKIARAVRTGEAIEWVRVTDLPDFVYFDHSRHVSKGVACQVCHGPVETMERVRQETRMTMGWCIECHRDYTTDPPPEIAPVSASVECSVCHY
jgi:hypothetical protein